VGQRPALAHHGAVQLDSIGEAAPETAAPAIAPQDVASDVGALDELAQSGRGVITARPLPAVALAVALRASMPIRRIRSLAGSSVSPSIHLGLLRGLGLRGDQQGEDEQDRQPRKTVRPNRNQSTSIGFPSPPT